ncbi:MAG: transglutaminase domain-containing protein [Aristaeellaceae bacterium]
MRRLAFSFRLRLEFSAPVQRHHFTLRCLPGDAPGQQVLAAAVRVTPGASLTGSADGCGLLQFGCIPQPHSAFEAVAEGVVRSGLEQVEPAAPRWQLGPYRMFTPLTAPGDALRRLDQSIPRDAKDEELGERIMALLSERFLYLPGSTDASTTAEEAAASMRGVCQDESHVMLSLLRMRGVPCRYAVGYMLGEGSTHAWVEMLQNGRWVGLDPTNSARIADECVRVSVGRDAADCPVNRGVFFGSAAQHSESAVRVWEAPEQCEGMECNGV